jgi:zinc transport system permease protein
LSAAVATILGALAIERVRVRLSESADMVLGIFFYSGMGLAVIFTGLNREGGFNLGSVLFGSLMTVSGGDLLIVAFLALCTVAFVVLFYRALQYITFDEMSARVAGLPVERLNLLLALLTALTVALSMRIVGLLLVSAMMVIPVACALQTARSFGGTIAQSMAYGVLTVAFGLTVSYYANLAPGGTIVVTGTLFFLVSCVYAARRRGDGEPESCDCKVCEEMRAEELNEGGKRQ